MTEKSVICEKEETILRSVCVLCVICDGQIQFSVICDFVEFKYVTCDFSIFCYLRSVCPDYNGTQFHILPNSFHVLTLCC